MAKATPWSQVEISFDESGRLLLRTLDGNRKFLEALRDHGGFMVDLERNFVVLTDGDVYPPPPPIPNVTCGGDFRRR